MIPYDSVRRLVCRSLPLALALVFSFFPTDSEIGDRLETAARAVAAVAVASYVAGLTLGAALHALNDWLANVPRPQTLRLAPPSVHPLSCIAFAAVDGLTVDQLRRRVRGSWRMRRGELIAALAAVV